MLQGLAAIVAQGVCERFSPFLVCLSVFGGYIFSAHQPLDVRVGVIIEHKLYAAFLAHEL